MKNIKNEFNKAQTLEEYFLIIGVDPRISLNNFLYNNTIQELNTFFVKDEICPKILSKFPPIKKNYIDIHSSIIDLCFQNEYKLEEFESLPDPETFHFILDNSFFSMDYLLKYVTCLKIYESLEQYFLLKNEIKDLLENEYHNSWKIFGTGKKGKKYKSENDLNKIIEYGRNKSEYEINDNNYIIGNKNFKNFKKYYFPKILCLVSTQPIFKEQEKLLKQIYKYYMDKTPKKIPLEKIILNILLNIPFPPRGIFQINYNLENKEKLIIKREKMNELSNIDNQLKLIFAKFSINKILIIFFNVLFESKIVFFSQNVSEISYFIHGMISLLFPFQYSFQISSSIPYEALDVLESISPFILGINTNFFQLFFKKNKIDTNGLNLLIIDLDAKSIKRIGKNNLPNIPKILYQPLIDELNKNVNVEKNRINCLKVRNAFFDFFINMMNDYETFLNKDYFMKKLSNSGIKALFKVNEFIEAHNNDKSFYTKLIETQMFCDFITKKLIPKNKKEHLEILFFDENILQKSNKKQKQKNNIILLNSKEYEYNDIYEVPKVKALSKTEKKFFINVAERDELILYGQKITEEKDKNSDDKDYLFNYFIFPVLNKNFYESIRFDEYYILPDIYSNIERINSDIIFQVMNNSKKKDNNKINQEMENYVYLAFVELWAFSYWYLDSSEKDQKFNQLIKILDKIKNLEIELFQHLFEALEKFQENEKIMTLYEILLKYKMTPSSYIFSLVNNILKKNKLRKSNDISFNSNSVESKYKSHLKRTFRTFNEINLLGDKVIFYTKQPCPECFKEIDILELSLNYKNMKKNIFWAQCPLCKKEIIPKLSVSLGSELINQKNKDCCTSINTEFTLLSTYEVKNNIKDIFYGSKTKLFHVINFKDNYNNLFWSCIWYFKINKIDFDMILPYEWNMEHNS